MSKQWGHGFYKGREDGLVEGYIEGRDYGKELGESVYELTLEITREYLRKHLRKRHSRYSCICPFCKTDTYTCMYDPFENEFYCFNCLENGNGYKLARKLEFPEADLNQQKEINK